MTPPNAAAFPTTPVLEARLQRVCPGDYRGTLETPDSPRKSFTSDRLDDLRHQVLSAARAHLRSEIGHPGRLAVEDPDGNWLFGVPHDGGDLVPLTQPPPSPAPSLPVPDPEATRVPRPVFSARRPRTPRRQRSANKSGSSSRRLVALVALAFVVVCFALVLSTLHHPHARAAADHSTPVTPAHATTSSRRPSRQAVVAHRRSPAHPTPEASHHDRRHPSGPALRARRTRARHAKRPAPRKRAHPQRSGSRTASRHGPRPVTRASAPTTSTPPTVVANPAPTATPPTPTATPPTPPVTTPTHSTTPSDSQSQRSNSGRHASDPVTGGPPPL
jgi:hypothetical protein